MGINPIVQDILNEEQRINPAAKTKSTNSIVQDILKDEEGSFLERAPALFGKGFLRAGQAIGHLMSDNPEAEVFRPQVEQLKQNLSKKSKNYQPVEANPELREKAADELIDKIAGYHVEPRDNAEKVVMGTGEFMFPGIGTKYGKAMEKGAKGLLKEAGKETALGLGASTALHATPHLTEEGGIGRASEDFVKMMFGVSAGQKLHGKAGQTVKYAENLSKSKKYKDAFKESGVDILDEPTGIKEKARDIYEKSAGKLLGKYAEPKIDILTKAEKYDIPLPYNLTLNHKVHNFLSNNFLKSSFTSDVFKKAFRDADARVVEEINKSINTLGGSQLKPTEASLKFKDFLKEEQEFAAKQSNILYDNASNFAKETDKVVPSETAKYVTLLKEITSNALPSDTAANSISGIVNDLSQKFGIGLSKKETRQITNFTSDPKLQAKLYEAFSSPKLPEVSTKMLIDIRQSLNRIIYKDPNAVGIKAQLRGLSAALEKDIEQTKNHQFISAWKEANNYHKNVRKQIFESDMARAITTGEAPTIAFDYLNNPLEIRELEKMMSRTPHGKQIFNDLKKSKVRQLLEGAVQGDLETGFLNSAAFAKKFNKNQKGQELLQELLGNEQYNKLADIAEIAQEFSNSKRELLNTSGTAIAASDIDTIKQTVRSSLKALYGIGATVAGGTIGGLPGALAGVGSAAVGMATPYVLSNIVSNPRIMNHAKAYALARKMGHEKRAESILNRMIPEIEKIVKEVGPYEIKHVGLHNLPEQEEAEQ